MQWIVRRSWTAGVVVLVGALAACKAGGKY
jgi:hypothetical protein